MSLSEIQKARLWWKTLPTAVREKIVLGEYEDSNQLVLKFPQVDMAGASNYPDDEIGGMADMYTDDEVYKEHKSRAVWETALAVELDEAGRIVKAKTPETEKFDPKKFCWAFDPRIGKNCAHAVVRGYAVSMVSGNRFKLEKGWDKLVVKR